MTVQAPKKPSHAHKAANTCFSLAHEASKPVHWSTYRVYLLHKSLQEKAKDHPVSTWEKVARFTPEVLLAFSIGLPLAVLSVSLSTLGSVFQAIAGKNHLEIQVGNPAAQKPADEDKLVIYNQNIGCLPGNISQDATVAPAKAFNCKTQEERREKAARVLIEKLQDDAEVITLQETQDRNFINEFVRQAEQKNLHLYLYTHFKDPWKVGIDSGITVISKYPLDMQAKALPAEGDFGQRFFFPKFVVSFTFKNKTIATTHLLPGSKEESGEGRKKQLEAIYDTFTEKNIKLLEEAPPLKVKAKNLVLLGDLNLREGEGLPEGLVEVAYKSSENSTMFIKETDDETFSDRVVRSSSVDDTDIDAEICELDGDVTSYSDHKMIRSEIWSF